MYDLDLDKIIYINSICYIFTIYLKICVFTQLKIDRHFNKMTGKIYESILFDTVTLHCIK
jgi:hypothetical protein